MAHYSLVGRRRCVRIPSLLRASLRILCAAAVAAAFVASCSTVASRSTDRGCESMPLPQFNLGGVTYIARQSTDTVAQAELGDLVGVQVGEIPQGLNRCESVVLKDGQGSLGPGAQVFAIRGVDRSFVIAGQVGTAYLRLYAP